MDSMVTSIRNCFNPRTREGATEGFERSHWPGIVSIHAPVRVRPALWGAYGQTVRVSIHAPVRVRPEGGAFFGSNASFNPRTREGAT